MKQAFFAYPDNQLLKPTIEAACQEIVRGDGLIMVPWVSLNVTGFKIDKLIRDRLITTEYLFADITYPNLNVYYEIGYALGLGKPVVPTLNVSIEKAQDNAKLVGIFDTIGQLRYTNSGELAQSIRQSNFEKWLPEMASKRNHGHPLFFWTLLSKLIFAICWSKP
jgi:hypothetical protein